MAKRQHNVGGKKETFPTGTTLLIESGATFTLTDGATFTLGPITETELDYLDGITIGQTLNSKCWVSDATGKIDVASGDTVNVDGTLSIANTTVTSSADELNTLDITAAGQSEDDKALVLDSGGKIDIASGDELNIDGTISIGDVAMVSTAAQLNQYKVSPVAGALGGSGVLVVSRVCSTAEINAGHVLVAALAGRTITVHGYRLLATGAADTATSIDLEDDNGSPVAISTVLVAAATDGAVISSDLVVANVTDATPLALTAEKGISITADGTVGTMTSMTVTVYYSVVDA